MSNSGVETLADRLKDADFSDDKPDFRELDLGSPVSPLRTRSTGPTQTTSSSSSSSGSFRVNPNPVSKGHSGELSG
ncbi:hypothetical protein PJK47_30810, partial [Mycobacterium kansasii]